MKRKRASENSRKRRTVSMTGLTEFVMKPMFCVTLLFSLTVWHMSHYSVIQQWRI